MRELAVFMGHADIDSFAGALATQEVIDKLEEPVFKMITGGYTPDMEAEADLFIFDVFEKSGHDPAKAADVFELLLELTPSDTQETTSLYSSHPETKARIAAIESRAADMESPTAPPPGAGFADLKRTFPTRKRFRRQT